MSSDTLRILYTDWEKVDPVRRRNPVRMGEPSEKGGLLERGHPVRRGQL